jgi:hypothetical protein
LVRVSIRAEDAGENAALYGWLRRDRDLARSAEVTGRGLPDSQTLSALDLIDVTLTHLTGLTSLALAVVAWRQSRPRPAVITVTRPGGQTLTIDGDSPATAELIRSFLAGADGTTEPDRGSGESDTDDAVAETRR